jgi:hypothetical protein
MGYEIRKSGRYYYRSERDPMTGRVKKRYVGRGPHAKAAATALEARRKQRADERLTVTRVDGDLRAIDSLMAELGEVAILLMEATLLAAGYHRHNYGPWRRRRGA